LSDNLKNGIGAAVSQTSVFGFEQSGSRQATARTGDDDVHAASFAAGPVTPTFTQIADLIVEVGARIAIGETAQGSRRVVPITRVFIQGVWLNRTILNAGADCQIIGPDGFTRLEARYVARLDDGALVYVENRGVRFGPPEVMARINRGEPVGPAGLYFQSTPRFQTAEPAHQWLTRPLLVAAGAWYPDRVALPVFEVG
jgi:hypothetical protein